MFHFRAIFDQLYAQALVVKGANVSIIDPKLKVKVQREQEDIGWDTTPDKIERLYAMYVIFRIDFLYPKVKFIHIFDSIPGFCCRSIRLRRIQPNEHQIN